MTIVPTQLEVFPWIGQPVDVSQYLVQVGNGCKPSVVDLPRESKQDMSLFSTPDVSNLMWFMHVSQPVGFVASQVLG